MIGINKISTQYLSADGSTYEVEVRFGPEAGIPEGAELRVREIPRESGQYEGYCQDAAEALGLSAANILYAKLLDISIVKDGAEVEPQAPVEVEIRLLDKAAQEEMLPLMEFASLGVVHYAGDAGEAASQAEASGASAAALDGAEEGDGLIRFEAESFSPYGIFYTVDFFFGGYGFSIEGGSSILLSGLFGELQIEENAAEAISVVFSDPALLSVTRAEADWILSSLKAFATEETLTVTMESGRIYEITVTDEVAGASELRFAGGVPEEDNLQFNPAEDVPDKFTFVYTPGASGTKDTFIVLQVPDFGVKITAVPTAGINNVRGIYYLDGTNAANSKQIAIVLNDGVRADFIADIGTKGIPVTGGDISGWLETGTPAPSSYRAKEYTLASGQSMDKNGINATVKDAEPLAKAESSKVAISWGSAAEGIVQTAKNQRANVRNGEAYKQTYHYTTLASPEYFSYRMNSKIQGYTGGSIGVGTWRNNTLRWEIPSVYESGCLVELKSIKLYVPDERLKLAALKKVAPDEKTQHYYLNSDTDLYAGDVDVGLEGLSVGGRQTDESGRSYYLLTPKTPLYNIGKGEKVEAKYYAFIPAFDLVDKNKPLDADKDWTVYTAPETVLTYHVYGEEGDRTLTQAGPVIEVMGQVQEHMLRSAYPVERMQNTGEYASRSDVVIGSYHSQEAFTYTVNGSIFGNTPPERIPLDTGPLVQSYSFPEAIQPQKLYLSDYFMAAYTYSPFYIASYKQVSLRSLEYEDSEGKSYSAREEEIAAINAAFLDDYQYNITSKYDPHMYAEYEFAKEATGNGKRVTKLTLVWDKLYRTEMWSYTHTYMQNWAGIGNTEKTDKKGTYYELSGGLVSNPRKEGWHNLGVYFDYLVAKPEGDAKDAYVDYAIMPEDGTASEENQQQLYFHLIDPETPYLYGQNPGGLANWSGVKTSYENWEAEEKLHARSLDGVSDVGIGDIGFYVGQYGEYADEIENPSITLQPKLGIDGASGYTEFTGIKEEEAAAFLTGTFTAMPELGGWVFECKAKNADGQEYEWTVTIPEITKEEGIAKDWLGLPDGYAFTSLRLSHPGKANLAHKGMEDPRTVLWLMKDIRIRRLNQNPFTEAKIETAEKYKNAVFALFASLKIGGGEGMEMTVPVDNKGIKYPPEMRMFSSRMETFKNKEDSRSVVLSAAQISQGNKITVTATNPVSVTYHGISGNIQFSHYSTAEAESHETIAGTNGTGSPRYNDYPWDVPISVYVELADPELMLDPASSKICGVPLTDAYVTTETQVLGDGRKFLKITLDPNCLYRNTAENCYFGSYFLARKTDLSQNIHIPFGSVALNFGSVALNFKVLSNAAIGDHYPVGKMYFDMSKAMELYNEEAPRDGITTYAFSENNTSLVEDTLGLSSSTVTGKKLYEMDLSQGGAQETHVNVIMAATAGASMMPGKRSELDAGLKTVFYTHDAGDLNAQLMLTGGTNPLEDMDVYLALPREGKSVAYLDGSGQTVQSPASGMTLRLRENGGSGGVSILSNNTGCSSGEIEISYTEDSAPGENSTYHAADEVTDWGAVTGLHIHAPSIQVRGSLTLDLLLETDTKTSLGTLRAYCGGTYAYGLPDARNPGTLNLSTWEYEDYNALGANGGFVFWDYYNEDGLYTAGTGLDAPFSGLSATLSDSGGNVIDRAVTDAAGKFQLKTYLSAPGQVVTLSAPDGYGTSVKLTKAKDEGNLFTDRGNDSDFPREGGTLSMTLGGMTERGWPNLSAGFVRLPELAASDAVLLLGPEKGDATAAFTGYLRGAYPADAYQVTFSASAEADSKTDSSIAAVESQTVRPASYDAGQACKVTAEKILRPVAVGSTFAQASISNRLGDVVTARFKITVEAPSLEIAAHIVAGEDENARFSFDVTFTTSDGKAPFLPAAGEGYTVDEANKRVSFVLQAGGSVKIPGIPYGTVAAISETAHDGYNVFYKKGEVNIANGDTLRHEIKETERIDVYNNAGVALPSTGGCGTWPYALGGVLLLASSAAAAAYLRRRRA